MISLMTCFREILGAGDYYSWIERYRMHPLNIFFNLLGIHALAGIEIKLYFEIARRRIRDIHRNDGPLLHDVLKCAVGGVKKGLRGGLEIFALIDY